MPRVVGTRRELIAAGVAFAGMGVAGSRATGANAAPAMGLRDRPKSCPFLRLEAEVHGLRRQLDAALDAFAAAEQAFLDAEADEAIDDRSLDLLWRQQEQADDDVGAACEATRAAAERLCTLPAENLAHIAIKARVALTLGFDVLSGIILEDIVRLAAELDPTGWEGSSRR